PRARPRSEQDADRDQTDQLQFHRHRAGVTMSTPKKTDTPAAPALAPNDELATLRANLEQLLNLHADQQLELEALKAAQTGKAATAVAQNDEAARMDAELGDLVAE